MYGQGAPIRQIASGYINILISQAGHVGEPEKKRLWMVRGDVKNDAQVVSGHVCCSPLSSKQGIEVKGPFDVHSENIHQPALQQSVDHVRPHAVGVQLYRQLQHSKLLQQKLQALNSCGLPAGDNHAFQHAFVRLQVCKHSGFVYTGQSLWGESQVCIVAGGAPEVAPAQKKNAAGVIGPVAQTKGFKTPHLRPNHANKLLFLRIGATGQRAEIPGRS